MAEGDIRRIFERLDQMGQELTRLVVLGGAKNRQCDQQEKKIADHEERITNLECQSGCIRGNVSLLAWLATLAVAVYGVVIK